MDPKALCSPYVYTPYLVLINTGGSVPPQEYRRDNSVEKIMQILQILVHEAARAGAGGDVPELQCKMISDTAAARHCYGAIPYHTIPYHTIPY